MSEAAAAAAPAEAALKEHAIGKKLVYAATRKLDDEINQTILTLPP